MMELIDDIGELKIDVSRAFSAALFSMDYHILKIILSASKDSKAAFTQKNYNQAQYIINKCFWDIGIYIKEKIEHYPSVESDFFNKIALNISNHLDMKDTMAFTPENLRRCYKLVELVDVVWFEEIAYNFPWSTLVERLDQSNSFNDLICFFD